MSESVEETIYQINCGNYSIELSESKLNEIVNSLVLEHHDNDKRINEIIKDECDLYKNKFNNLNNSIEIYQRIIYQLKKDLKKNEFAQPLKSVAVSSYTSVEYHNHIESITISSSDDELAVSENKTDKSASNKFVKRTKKHSHSLIEATDNVKPVLQNVGINPVETSDEANLVNVSDTINLVEAASDETNSINVNDKINLLEASDEANLMEDEAYPVDINDKTNLVETSDEDYPMEICDEAYPVDINDKINPIETSDEDYPMEVCDEANPVDTNNKINLVEASDESNSVNPNDKINLVEASDEANSIKVCDEANLVDISDTIKAIDISDKINPVETSDEVYPIEVSDEANPVDASDKINPTEASVEGNGEANLVDTSDRINPVEASNVANPINVSDNINPVNASHEGNVFDASVKVSILKINISKPCPKSKKIKYCTNSYTALTVLNVKKKYPPPFPSVGFNPQLLEYIPSAPKLMVKSKGTKVTLTWDMERPLLGAGKIKMYELFICQETDEEPRSSMWKLVCYLEALSLPMKCKLDMYEKGFTYHFALRAVDEYEMQGHCSIDKVTI